MGMEGWVAGGNTAVTHRRTVHSVGGGGNAVLKQRLSRLLVT